MKYWFLCYNKTTRCLLTCPIDCYKSEQYKCFMDASRWPPPFPSFSLFLLCKYIIWLSGLWFKCRSINLQVPAWCLHMILAQRHAKGALTLMTPAGCQFWAGLAWLAWVGRRPAGYWVGKAESCKETTRSALWQNTSSTLMPICENADVLTMVVVKLKGLRRLPAPPLSKEQSFILKVKCKIFFIGVRKHNHQLLQ